jgi:BCD family chlorophyll transporter-like MFS transporter
LSLAFIAAAAALGPRYPFSAAVFALGASNGVFAVAAIGSMMGLAGSGAHSREGIRMGLWGAAQAVAFGLGGFLATAGVDVARIFVRAPAAYAMVFVVEALLFVAAARLASGIRRGDAERKRSASGAQDPVSVGA